MKKHIAVYTVILAIFSVLIYFTLKNGEALSSGILSTLPRGAAETPGNIAAQLFENTKHPMALLLLQVTVILVVSRIFGLLTRFIKQPSVIGEIAAGIVLGPSLLGLLFPDFFAYLFPAESLKALNFLSQLGLTFFMFTIGMELDLESIKSKARDAIVISHTGIIFPFFLGVLTAYFLYQQYATPGSTFLAFALFMGISMSITAFPVLARIIKEKGLGNTHLGKLALTSAAADDVTAWCVLAIVIAFAKATALSAAFYTIILTVAFIAFMLLVVGPLLRMLGKRPILNQDLSKNTVAVSFCVLLVSSYIADVIGIHVLFGAFLAGVVMPPNEKFKELLTYKLEDVSSLILLPIFFAITGLRTQIGLLNEPAQWLLCLAIIGIAVLGKFGGATAAAKLVGQPWRSSFSIGALMNTRGLMELVVLNIGYDMGILSAELFAIMVLMALATTFMTSPLLDFINYVSTRKPASQKHTNGAHV
ncbi:MAG: cation:proton antiporter [Bacteroidetes bacterium]|nr:cation:proton antiporter [Bacteroidota bacterium]